MKKIKNYLIPVVFCFLFAFLTGCVADNHVKILYSNESSQEADQVVRWQEVQNGLEYANVLAGVEDGSRKEFFIVKIDPNLFEFKVYNNAEEKDAKTLKKIHQELGSVLTFNGAFFDEDFKAMGLLQDSDSTSHKQIHSELMNGVFYVGTESQEFTGVPAGVRVLENVPQKNEWFMIQNGPVLIENNGNIPLTKDTEKLAARTAIGVDNEGKIVLVVLHQSLLNTDNTLSLYRFAHLLKEHKLFAPMGLHSVLNLDGGPSTGVIIGGEYLPEISSVQNAVITVPRAV